MSKPIIIFDTTLRDGEQAPGFGMNFREKLRMATQLELLGVDVMEAGFPACSEGDFQAAKAIAETVRNSTVAGLCRTRQEDIDRAGEAIAPANKGRIHTFIATSDIHLEHKLKLERREVLKEADFGVRHARTWCDDVEFSAEDASRSDPEFLYEVIQTAVEAGATTINIPDTVGFSVPWEFGELIAGIRKRVPDHVNISVHCHDDLGMAVANSLMAVQNGADQIECTINGIGERAGNASLEEVVMAIFTRQNQFDCHTNINHEQIYPTSQLLTEITEQRIQSNKAVVGENAFSHEAGIHQHGVISNPLTYEIMTPKTIGKEGNNIVLGKHSGRKAVSHRLQELGFEFTKTEVERIYQGFIKLCDRQKVVTDADLIYLASNGVTELGNEFVQNTMQEYLNK